MFTIISCFLDVDSFQQIQKGAASARSDDTRSLKGSILDWISSPHEPLCPPLARNVKMDRGFHHERTGMLLCPVELDWCDPESVVFVISDLDL